MRVTSLNISPRRTDYCWTARVEYCCNHPGQVVQQRAEWREQRGKGVEWKSRVKWARHGHFPFMLRLLQSCPSCSCSSVTVKWKIWPAITYLRLVCTGKQRLAFIRLRRTDVPDYITSVVMLQGNVHFELDLAHFLWSPLSQAYDCNCCWHCTDDIVRRFFVLLHSSKTYWW